MEATIYKSTGSWYLARCKDGTWRNSRLAGRFKTDSEISSSNPVAVGDQVIVEIEDKQDSAFIVDILKRKNYIVRASPKQGVSRHILAANIDQAVLIVTLKNPFTSLGFVDRFLVTAAAYHIPAILIFNKTDLYEEKEKKKLEKVKAVYSPLCSHLLEISAIHSQGDFGQIEPLFKGKITLLTGHSGSGKSTLINQLIPGQNRKTQDVSHWSGKGIHTTTYAEMLDLPTQGKVIDTPGVREWGIVDMEPTILAHYFAEMRPYVSSCKFNNCLHKNEPGCAIKKAAESGTIDPGRYKSYLSILASIKA